MQNTLRCIRESGVEIDEIVVNSLASAQAVLDEHQKELGAVVIDIGGGVTDYIVYENGVVRHSGVLAVGGDHMTSDISLGLRIPLTRAEKLKVDEGSASSAAVAGEKIVLKNDAGFAGKEIEREILNGIINSRIREILGLVKKQVEPEVSLPMLGAGVILTGGCSLMKGIKEVAESIFELPVHLARDTGVSGPKSVLNNPQYSTAIGLIKFAQALRAEVERPGLIGSVLEKIGGIFRKRGWQPAALQLRMTCFQNRDLGMNSPFQTGFFSSALSGERTPVFINGRSANFSCRRAVRRRPLFSPRISNLNKTFF